MADDPQAPDPFAVLAQQPVQMPQLQQPPAAQPQLATQPVKGHNAKAPGIYSLIKDMVQPPTQVQADPGGMASARPVSRLDVFENFLGNFLNSLGQGMANQGHGPGSWGRGFGAAVQAPMVRQQQQQQLEQGQEQIQGDQTRNALAQQQLAYGPAQHQAQIAALTQQPRFSPQGQYLGNMNDAQYQQYLRGGQAAQVGAQSRADTTAANNKTKTDIATQNNQSKANSLAEKVGEFKTTDDYRKWKTTLDNDTRVRVANMSADKAPAALIQTATFAKGGLDRLSDADAAMQRLEAKGVFGSVGKNKVEDWVFGKGLVDPSLDSQTRADVGKLRAALGYTSSAAMRAHTGRTSQEIYNDFKSRLGAGQDWSALRGAMDETKGMLSDYANSASDKSIRAIRQGSSGNAVGDLVNKYK